MASAESRPFGVVAALVGISSLIVFLLIYFMQVAPNTAVVGLVAVLSANFLFSLVLHRRLLTKLNTGRRPGAVVMICLVALGTFVYATMAGSLASSINSGVFFQSFLCMMVAGMVLALEAPVVIAIALQHFSRR